MKYASHLFALAVVVAGLFRVAPALAQPLSYDRAVVCGSGQGPYGWGPWRVAVDAGGNTFTAGRFSGTVQFGSTLLTTTQGVSDNFVAKLDASGTYVWAAQMADGQDTGISDLAVGMGGDVYVTGAFHSFSARFGLVGPVLYNSSARSEGFVAKLSGATGQWLWARRTGGTGDDYVGPVAVNVAGEVYVVGYSNSAVTDAGPFTLNGQQSFLAKLSTSGTWLWARRVGTGKVDASNLLLDAQGDLYVSGSFGAPSATFGATTLATQGVPGSYFPVTGSELFVAKMTDAGAWRWAVQGDAVTQQNLIFPSSLVSDGAGHLYIAGGYESTAARIGGTVLPNLSARNPPPIGPAPPVPYTNNYKGDAFVARLDAATGAWDWAVRNGGPDDESASGIGAVDSQGRLYLMGSFVSPTPSGARGGFAQLDGATGAWQRVLDLGPFRVNHATMDGQDRLHLAGFFDSATARFGPVTLAQAGAGNSTGFVARTGAGVLATAGARPSGTDLNIWPNPAGQGPVQVQGPLLGQLVQVFDVLGRAVAAGYMPAHGPLALVLPTSAAAGLYVVRSGAQARQLVIE